MEVSKRHYMWICRVENHKTFYILHCKFIIWPCSKVQCKLFIRSVIYLHSVNLGILHTENGIWLWHVWCVYIERQLSSASLVASNRIPVILLKVMPGVDWIVPSYNSTHVLSKLLWLWLQQESFHVRLNMFSCYVQEWHPPKN